MHGAVHRRDRREVDDLHVAAEARVADDLAGGPGVDGDDLGVAQVEDVAAVEELVLLVGEWGGGGGQERGKLGTETKK